MLKDEILNEYSQLYGQLNEETRQHSFNVAEMCGLCGAGLNLDPDISYRIGLLHDVGKIFIPSRILKKNMKLTSIEREMIDLHSYFGYRILRDAGEEPVVYLPVLFHHGFNKPRLSSPNEPLTMQILKYTYLVHSVDIYDAMAQKRVYHDEYSKDRIFDTLFRDQMCPPDVLLEIRLMDRNSCTENGLMSDA